MIEKKERGRTVVYTSLSDMISALEAGTELHIGIAFFPSARGRLSPLPAAQMIHSSPYCMQMKRDARQMEECYGIREKKLRRAKEQREPFVSLCPCGITEYLHPVILRNTVVCLLMISGKTPKDGEDPDFLTSAQCKAKALENHVQLLMEASPPVSRESDPFAAQAAELLSEGITEKLSVKELARSLGYHEKYFGAKFKQKTGKSPRAYRNDRRLSKAEGYLRNTALPIIEIATLVGFDNVSYFNRLFRQRHQMTPTQYRKRNRK